VPDRIAVTEPTHPFYGLTFPCHGLTLLPGHGRACVVEIAQGIERRLPVAITNLGAFAPVPSPCRLSVTAIQALLAVLASVVTDPDAPAVQEEGHDSGSACSPATDPAARPGGRCGTNAVRRTASAAPGGLGQPLADAPDAGLPDRAADRGPGGA
jgi:hypothetical protein